MALGALLAGGALLGGLAGSQGKKSRLSVDAGSATALETQGANLSSEQLKNLQSLINAGPGQESIGQASDAGNNLAQLLQRLQSTGGMGSAEEQAMARTQAGQLFAPQQEAMNQSLEQSRIQAGRMSARMGRQINDPILNAKLAQERANQTNMLEAQKTSFAAGAGSRSLDMASQLFNLRQGIASQALQNRQNLFAMGQQAVSAERNFRLGTATRTESGGGGMAGAIGGALAGAGTAASIGNMFGMGAGGDAVGKAVGTGVINEKALAWGAGGMAAGAALSTPPQRQSYGQVNNAPQTYVSGLYPTQSQPYTADQGRMVSVGAQPYAWNKGW